MTKVKLFSGNTSLNIEADINRFLSDPEITNVLDIKLNSSEAGARNCNVLVVYEVEDE